MSLKKKPSERQSVGVYVRFTPGEGKEIKKAAGKKNIATFLRDLILSAIR